MLFLLNERTGLPNRSVGGAGKVEQVEAQGDPRETAWLAWAERNEGGSKCPSPYVCSTQASQCELIRSSRSVVTRAQENRVAGE